MNYFCVLKINFGRSLDRDGWLDRLIYALVTNR